MNLGRLGILGGFSDEQFVAGDEETRRQARDELRREQEQREAMRSGLPEIERSRLQFERFHIADETGVLYGRVRGVVDPQSGGAIAYYLDAAGNVVYLEAPPGTARTLDEREQQRAEREQLRAEQAAQAAAPRPWARR